MKIVQKLMKNRKITFNDVINDDDLSQKNTILLFSHIFHFSSINM